MKIKILALISCILLIAQIVIAAENSPKNIVDSTISEILNVVNQHVGDTSKEIRRAELRKIINPNFDFREMAKRSLGSFWNTITPEQRAEFVNIFSDLLANTYLKRIEHIEPNMVTVKGEKIVGNKGRVFTVIEDDGDKFPIEYRFYNNQGSWKVYDVVIENIGLVTNYRNEFAGIIRREKFEGLIQRLKDKQTKEAKE